MTNQKINEGLLSFIYEQTGRRVIYEQEPTPLLGGMNATTYKFKLRGMDPMVLRLLGSKRNAEEAKRIRIHSQALICANIRAPKVHWVCEKKSALGGVFTIMEFFPDPLLAKQSLDIQFKVLGASHAELHNHSTASVINELKSSGLNENQFMASLFMPLLLDSAQTHHPWLSNIITWLQNNLPVASGNASINHGDYHSKNIMYNSDQVTGIIDWHLYIGDPAFDIGKIITFIMDIAPNVAGGLTREMALENYWYYRNSYQSVKSINMEAVNACRVSRCTTLLLHCLSGKKDDLTTSPGMLKNLKTTIESITNLEIELPCP